MASLSGKEIKKAIESGIIKIDPFNESQLQPASYDVRLAPLLLRITDDVLDFKQPYATQQVIIPEEGLPLEPGQLYLGSTVERTTSPFHRPKYDGRSTTGRYFLLSHQTAGFGDPGFDGHWTLEITVAKLTIIYPYMRIGQVSFETIVGEIDTYKGNYNAYNSPKVGKPNNI